jgi:calcineurin-like phosphoesterase
LEAGNAPLLKSGNSNAFMGDFFGKVDVINGGIIAVRQKMLVLEEKYKQSFMIIEMETAKGEY